MYMMISSITNDKCGLFFFSFNPYTFFLALLHWLGMPVQCRVKVIAVGNIVSFPLSGLGLGGREVSVIYH